MAIDDIDILREQIPELFADRQTPPGWEEDWLVIPIDDPEAGSLAAMPEADYEEPLPVALDDRLDPGNLVNISPESEIPTFGKGPPFPGAPQDHQGGTPPSPDALAFYLPFHYFHPTWWGVYLVLERVHWLAQQLEVYSAAALGGRDALTVARLFLYSHEAFHHSVETFATRLEITHRVPLYRDPFEQYFRKVFGTTECIEEALATAHGYRKVRDKAFRKPNDPKKRQAALVALQRYIRVCPPGYNRALEFVENAPFAEERGRFSEDNHRFVGHVALDQPMKPVFLGRHLASRSVGLDQCGHRVRDPLPVVVDPPRPRQRTTSPPSSPEHTDHGRHPHPSTHSARTCSARVSGRGRNGRWLTALDPLAHEMDPLAILGRDAQVAKRTEHLTG